MTTSYTFTDVRLTLAYLAEQPIIHTEETIGNISKIKKMRIVHNGGVVLIPAVSGNSFRGQLRDVLADRMFAVLSNNGQQQITLSNDIYGALYSGGALGERSTLDKIMKQLTDAIPMLRVMGAAFGNVMWPSKFAATHIIPCAQETEDILQSVVKHLNAAILPAKDQWPKGRDLIFNDGPLTRKDDSRDPYRQRFVNLKSEDEQKQQMIYYVECITPGTWLLQQIYSKYPLDDLELGCFFDALESWLKTPSIGGRSAAGYGQVQLHIRGKAADEQVEWPDSWPDVVNKAIETYRTYLTEKKTDLLEAMQATVEE
ncbi:MAG: hypothetical protein GY797_30685 [Deltaproteobacteria bacterium]|nr:hypothetical protein [Deltaproteobacteria bacterium]